MQRSANSSVSIFIIDDDPAVQQALRLLCRSAGYQSEVYSSGADFLKAYGEHMAGCVLLDVRMPGMSGLELQEALNARHSILPIVFMTGHADVPMAVNAMQSGAMDFIQKPFSDEELLERLRQAVQRDIFHRSLLQEKAEIRRRLGSLTPREHEILNMVINGKANKVIAGDLQLSQRTVEIHRARVMEKMQATSLAHLVRMVIAIDEPDGVKPGVTKLTRA